MQNLEALMRDVLSSVSFDIFFQEQEFGLISLDWVNQVIGIDLLGFLSQERSNCFNARRRLHVLRINQFVEIFLHFLRGGVLDLHFV
jgi:hypothetical protein